MEAINLYMKAGLPARAARLAMSREVSTAKVFQPANSLHTHLLCADCAQARVFLVESYYYYCTTITRLSFDSTRYLISR